MRHPLLPTFAVRVKGLGISLLIARSIYRHSSSTNTDHQWNHPGHCARCKWGRCSRAQV